MKSATLLTAVAIPASILAATLELPSLRPGEMPNPEVSFCTNLSVRLQDFKAMHFDIDVAAPSLTNEIAVAVGNDADEDGDLSFDEAAFMWGCDCGEWYCADLETGAVSAGPTNSLTVGRRTWNAEWNLVKVIRRGLGEQTESVTAREEHTWLYIRIK